MRPILRRMLLLLAAFGAANGACADEPGVTIPPELILQRFAVNKGGDALLVPVKIAGKDRLFVVDTGCSMTILDDSLAPGESKQVVTMGTAIGTTKVKVHGPPEASIRGIPLQLDSVLSADLKGIREGTGYPIEGLLRMDFLGRYVVRIDFDRGELLLLKSRPDDSGEILPLHPNPLKVPELEVRMSGEEKVRFMVDTGCMSFSSGMIKSYNKKSLIKIREIPGVNSFLATKPLNSPLFQERRLSLGQFSVERPVFVESPTSSLLGLYFLSRFVVTFDFPAQKLYLRRGRDFEKSDIIHGSGMSLLRRDGQVVVDDVDQDLPASSAGIENGDVLLAVGTTRAGELSVFELHKALCQPGSVECTVRRGTQERRLTLTLPR